METTVHNVEMRVFAKEDDDLSQVRNTLMSLLPFDDLVKEKILVEEQNASGFADKQMIIFEIKLDKQRHVRKFIDRLIEKLGKEQKEILIRQVESRLDDEMNFFIRLDKTRLIEEKKWLVTDSGDCYHIKLSIAAYPAKKDIAIETVKMLFSEEGDEA